VQRPHETFRHSDVTRPREFYRLRDVCRHATSSSWNRIGY
jgi:hypothetical protein